MKRPVCERLGGGIVNKETSTLPSRLVDDEQAEYAAASARKTTCAGPSRWRQRIDRIEAALDVLTKPPSLPSNTPPALLALEAASALAENAEELRDLLLLAARESGAKWSEIAEVLDMTPQGVQYRASIIQAAHCAGTPNTQPDRNHR